MLELIKISKDYVTSSETVKALKEIDLTFRDKEFVSILGPSGCGKTTLIREIARQLLPRTDLHTVYMPQHYEDEMPQEKTPTLLLHACCAPCSSYCLEYLANYFSITLYFFNPNIYQGTPTPSRLEIISFAYWIWFAVLAAVTVVRIIKRARNRKKDE